MENAAEFVSTALQIILCIVLVVVEFCTERMQRTRSAPLLSVYLLRAGSVCLVHLRFCDRIALVDAYQVYHSFSPGWKLYSGRALHLAFLLFMIFGLRFLQRETASPNTPTI